MNAEVKTCPYCFEEIRAEATKCRWCRSTLTPAFAPGTWVAQGNWSRDLPGRRFLGVASALAANTGVTVLVWRVMFIILTLFHGVGAIAYFAIWALTPFRQKGQAPLERGAVAARQAYKTMRTDKPEAEQT